MNNIPSSVKTAGVLTLIVVAYFAFGTLVRGNTAPASAEKQEKPLFQVVTENISPAPMGQIVEMRGSTKALQQVMVRAETPGQVRRTPAREGTAVKRGDVLCEISVETRNASLAEAEAALKKAQIDYDAAVSLAEKGFQSNAAVAAARAALDLSEANLKRARTDLGKTLIRAPFDGVLQEQIAEPGDFLPVGNPCAVVARLDTLLIAGALSEKEVTQLTLGDEATVTLTGGTTMQAKVSYISQSATPATRSFVVELEGKNPGSIPAGITANATIATGSANAYNIPRNAMVLNDVGQIGIRHVTALQGEQGRVAFTPVSVISDDSSGVWVSGPSGEITLVTRGQEYVQQGQTVVIIDAADLPATTG
jgi:multidrug efflux system membrane fusion protein